MGDDFVMHELDDDNDALGEVSQIIFVATFFLFSRYESSHEEGNFRGKSYIDHPQQSGHSIYRCLDAGKRC